MSSTCARVTFEHTESSIPAGFGGTGASAERFTLLTTGGPPASTSKLVFVGSHEEPYRLTVQSFPREDDLSEFDRLVRELRQLTGRNHWNDGRGRATSPSDWNRIREIATLVAVLAAAPRPVPSAESDGSVCVRWTTARNDITLEIKGEDAWLTTLYPNGRGEELTLHSRDQRLVDMVIGRLL
jgi:hypothetical protein